MKSVTPEEAQISLEKQTKWAKNPTKSRGESLDDKISQDAPNSDINPTIEESTKPSVESDDWKEIQQSGISLLINGNKSTYNTTTVEKEEQDRPLETPSLTTNAIQLNWKHRVLFPCCPQQITDNPLEVYLTNLKEGVLFSENNYGKSFVIKAGMPQADCLWVMCNISIGFKTHAITKITFEDGFFYHENKGVYDIGDEPEEMFESIMNGNLKL